jgi:hypothetical protein
MIADVKSSLDAILGNVVTLQHAAGAGRIYELFIMTSIARELKRRHFDVWLQRSDGTRVNPGDADLRFIQRGGAPTGIAGAAQGPNNASSIAFQRPHRLPWEIWNGVQFYGRSSAKHEIDLAIVPATVGQTLRAQVGGGIPTGRPRVAIECKDVGTTGSVDEMRAFVARLYDLTLLSSHHSYLSFPTAQALHPGSPPEPKHGAVMTYWEENKRTMNVFARRTGFSEGAAALTSYYAVEPYGSVTVGSASAVQLVDDVVTWIIHRSY